MTEKDQVFLGYWRRREDALQEANQFAANRLPVDHPLRQLKQSDDAHLPWPVGGVLNTQQIAEAVATLNKLEPKAEPVRYKGYSACRLCDEKRNGSTEFWLPQQGKVYCWPQGLRHYVVEHGVALPAEFQSLLVNQGKKR